MSNPLETPPNRQFIEGSGSLTTPNRPQACARASSKPRESARNEQRVLSLHNHADRHLIKLASGSHSGLHNGTAPRTLRACRWNSKAPVNAVARAWRLLCHSAALT